MSYVVNLPDKCRCIVSPLKPAMWEVLLTEHPDRQFVDYLTQGLREGFHIGCCASQQNLQLVSTNILSAMLYPEVIQKYLQEEVESKRVMEIPLRCLGIFIFLDLGLPPRNVSQEGGG